MKTLLIVAGLSLALVGCVDKKGTPEWDADNAICKAYADKDMCAADAKCEWHVTESGGEHCRAVR